MGIAARAIRAHSLKRALRSSTHFRLPDPPPLPPDVPPPPLPPDHPPVPLTSSFQAPVEEHLDVECDMDMSDEE